MEHRVTFETALALRAAGFPQPVPAFGQIWYDTHYPQDRYGVLTDVQIGGRVFTFNPISGGFSRLGPRDIESRRLIYAPCATEIQHVKAMEFVHVFQALGRFRSAQIGMNSNENPAELMAKIYLQK
jgi:hypothetical protein